MIYYIIKENDKLATVRVQTTTEVNKIKIPKSTITTKGIMDSVIKDDITYLESIEYNIVKDGEGKASLAYLEEVLLPSLVEEDIVYILSEDIKPIVVKKELHLKYKNFVKFSFIDVSFMTTLCEEICKLDYNKEYRVLDLTSYLRSSIQTSKLLNSRQLFFYKDMPEGYYYSYQNKETISKRDDISVDIGKTRLVLGKKSNSNVYSILKTKPITILDNLYKSWRSKLEYDLYAIMLLDRVNNTKNIHYSNDLIFNKDPNRLDSPTGETLISEIRPAGLSYYAFKTFEELQAILDDFISTEDTLVKKCSVDITSRVYDDKHVILHLSEFIIDYDYLLNDKTYKLTIVSSLDIPSRNVLKNLSKEKPKINLIIINENNVVARHYIVIESGGEYLLTCNYPTNMTLLEK